MRRLVSRLGLALLGTLLGVGLAEGLVRWFDPLGISYFRRLHRYSAEALQASPVEGLEYEHVRNRVVEAGVRYRFDARGLRGPGVADPKPSGTLRVVVLGDSVTLGWGVEEEETFCVRVAGALASRRGGAVEVVNAGVVGYDTAQEERWFAAHGLSLEPDLVLLVPCPNDVGRAPSGVPGAPPDPGPRPDALAGVVSRFDWWILTRPTDLDAFRLLRFWTLVRLLNPPRDEGPALEGYRARIQRIEAFLATGTTVTEPSASLAAADRLRESCAAAGVPLVVAPFGVVPWIVAWCEERGVPCLPPVLDVEPDRTLRVSAMDGHPNGAGHARIAERIVQGLERLGLP